MPCVVLRVLFVCWVWVYFYNNVDHFWQLILGIECHTLIDGWINPTDISMRDKKLGNASLTFVIPGNKSGVSPPPFCCCVPDRETTWTQTPPFCGWREKGAPTPLMLCCWPANVSGRKRRRARAKRCRSQMKPRWKTLCSNSWRQ